MPTAASGTERENQLAALVGSRGLEGIVCASREVCVLCWLLVEVMQADVQRRQQPEQRAGWRQWCVGICGAGKNRLQAAGCAFGEALGGA